MHPIHDVSFQTITNQNKKYNLTFRTNLKLKRERNKYEEKKQQQNACE